MEPIIDPILKNKVPEDWIRKSKYPREVLRDKINSGKWVLTQKGEKLERGFSTGTVACAAIKGAFLPKERNKIKPPTPIGIRPELDINSKEKKCIVTKPTSDHSFDSTEKIKIKSELISFEEKGISFKEGIGVVKEESFDIKPGEHSVSHVVRNQMKKALNEGIKELKEAKIELKIFNISKKAIKINERFGIEGGISLLGTTGFVEPWNDKLLESRLKLVEKFNKIVLTTGMMGMKHCGRIFSDHRIIKIGKNFEKLEEMDLRNKNVVLCGLPALILKYGSPDILKNTGFTSVKQLVSEKPEHEKIDRALDVVQEKLPSLKIVLVKKDGEVLRRRSPIG